MPEACRSGRDAPLQPSGQSRTRAQKIVVPIMGEGIRAAKVVSLLKKPGDKIQHDDPLCEVETDKAVYPIESSFAGTMGEWKTEVGATCRDRRGTRHDSRRRRRRRARRSNRRRCRNFLRSTTQRSGRSLGVRNETRRSAKIRRNRARAFSQQSRAGLIASFQRTFRSTRVGMRFAKRATQQERKTERTRRHLLSCSRGRSCARWKNTRRFADSCWKTIRIIENDEFDLGVAVALEDDRLATAVVTRANKRDWPDFVQRYNETVERNSHRPRRCGQRAGRHQQSWRVWCSSRQRRSLCHRQSARCLSAPRTTK